MHSGSFRKSEASDEPASPEGRRVMVKQIVASNFNGVAHCSFWLGIILGLNDIFTSTITTGFDLEGDTAEKYNEHCRIPLGLWLVQTQKPNW